MAFFKLGRLRDDGEWVAHEHPRSYQLPSEGASHPRLTAGLPSGDVSVFRALCACMTPPFYLLYVLHTPRGEANPGRYQSPAISMADLDAFLERYEMLLTGDARFDLWIHSPTDEATVVWDRHDELFAYGPIGGFTAALIRCGFVEGAVVVPVPHEHHYRAECDVLAADLVRAYAWRVTPLRPEDEQIALSRRPEDKQ